MTQSYWETKFKKDYSDFLKTIVESQPDFIVPVARKCIKLMDAIQHDAEEFQSRIRYLDYFDFAKTDLSKSRVVIFDDAVRTASTLKDYRNYFEAYLPNPPTEILTYGFIGHSQLRSNPEINQEKNVKIFFYRSEASYLEYIAQQAEFLIRKGTQPDIDHMVIELEVSDLGNKEIQKLWEFLPKLGYSYQLEPIKGTDRFGLHSPSFFPFEEILEQFDMNIKRDFVEKIKFCHLKELSKFHAVPMYFPILRTDAVAKCNLNNLMNLQLPFKVPCQYRGEHHQDKICYQSVCLVLNSLLARSFFLILRDKFKSSQITSKNISLKRRDLVRYLGTQVGNELVNNIEEFIKADQSPLDNLILQDKSDQKTYFQSNLTPPINRENVPSIFTAMRVGYDEKVRKKGSSVGTHFTKSADEMMAMGGGTHPLVFTEVLDEYCDAGALVPVTDDERGAWQRLYRTGEGPDDYLSWDRTKYIIAFAVEELTQNGGVHRMLLEKALTNFIFDFPYPELHVLGERESLWGPQTFAYHKLKNVEIPIDNRPLRYERLYDWRNLAEYFDYDAKRQMYVRKTKPFKNITKYFDGDSRVNEKLVRQYFQAFSHLNKSFGNSNFIYSLAICRENQTFLRYLLKSIGIWISAYKAFLEDIDQGKVNSETLQLLGYAARSSRDKIRYSKTFGDDFKKAGSFLLESKQELYDNVWISRINENISWDLQPLIRYPEVHMLANVTDGVSLIFELTRLKLGKKSQIVDREKVEIRVKQDGKSILERVGISDKILHWPDASQEPDFDVLSNELSEALSTLRLIVKNIKLDKTPTVSRDERLEKRQETILVSTSSEPPQDVKAIAKVVMEYAQEFGLINPKIEGITNLDDGSHFVDLREAFGDYWRAEVVWKEDHPHVKRMQKINPT